VVSPTSKPLGYEKTIARLRQAQLEKEMIELQLNRTDFKRYTEMKPFDISDSFKKRHELQPLMYLDVAVSPDQIERIAIYPGTNPTFLARDFGAAHQLDGPHLRALEELIRHQLYELELSNSKPKYTWS
jgi:hypothetical protein